MINRLLFNINKQLNNFFEITQTDNHALNLLVLQANNETVNCLRKVNNKYCLNTPPVANTIFSNGYTIFLYKLSNLLYKNNYIDTASKVYYLNKIINNVELFYEVELPEYFFVEHPLGSVIGRAQYGQYFYFCHGCTVGENNGKHPKIGNFVSMMSGSKILGNSIIGDNCIISANTYVKDSVVPANTIVFNSHKGLIFKNNINVKSIWVKNNLKEV